MELVVFAKQSVLESAISTAAPSKGALQIEGLHSLLDAVSSGVLSEIWDEVVRSLRIGFELGLERARPVFEKAIQTCEQLLQGAGAAAVEIVAALRDRLQKFVQDYIGGILSAVQASIKIGDKELQLEAVDVQHKIVLGGDVSLSLQQVFKIVASGELNIAAKYGRPAR